MQDSSRSRSQSRSRSPKSQSRSRSPKSQSRSRSPKSQSRSRSPMSQSRDPSLSRSPVHPSSPDRNYKRLAYQEHRSPLHPSSPETNRYERLTYQARYAEPRPYQARYAEPRPYQAEPRPHQARYQERRRSRQNDENLKLYVNMQPCAFFNTPRGCKNGSACSFVHDPKRISSKRTHPCPTCRNICLGLQCNDCRRNKRTQRY